MLHECLLDLQPLPVPMHTLATIPLLKSLHSNSQQATLNSVPIWSRRKLLMRSTYFWEHYDTVLIENMHTNRFPTTNSRAHAAWGREKNPNSSTTSGVQAVLHEPSLLGAPFGSPLGTGAPGRAHQLIAKDNAEFAHNNIKFITE